MQGLRGIEVNKAARTHTCTQKKERKKNVIVIKTYQMLVQPFQLSNFNRYDHQGPIHASQYNKPDPCFIVLTTIFMCY